MKNGRILLVEDEELVGTMVRMNLESAGYEVVWQRDGECGLEMLKTESFDLLLLDITLPKMNGLDVLAQVRSWGVVVPVMMLTARGDVPTKVAALEQGADDYLPKPFDVAELVARVNALVRRSQSQRQIPSDRIVHFGAYKVNLETREAVTNEGTIVLSEKEAAVLNLLVRERGRALSRSDILEEIWGMDVSPTERTVDNFIVRLRKLFEPEADKTRHFLTVRGVGYRFVP